MNSNLKTITKKTLPLTIAIVVVLLSVLSITFGSQIVENLSIYQKKATLTEERQAVYDKMKVDYVNIKSRVTGTEPWNPGTTSNADGVDVSENDDYVRTFDVMKYTIELGVSPNTSIDGVTEASIFKGGVIKVRAKLPNQDNLVLMSWEQDAWMQNVTYNEDKTEIYAEYHVPSGVSITNANQNLSFTVKINGYKQEVTSEIAPEFEVWMEGNQPDNKTSNVPSITEKDTRKLIISAHPSYDIKLTLNPYFNQTATRNNVKGNYYNFNVSLILYQDVAGINDLRGIEYPVDKIELDLEFAYNYNDISNSDPIQTITPSTENYNGLANGTELVAYGINGDNSVAYYPVSNWFTQNRNLPMGSYKVSGSDSQDKSVYDSGDFTFTIEDNKMHIAFENFKFNGIFPVYSWASDKSAQTFGSNQGYFAVGNVELFTPYYNDGLGSYEYTYNINLTSWSYSTLNEKNVTITKKDNADLDAKSSNNSIAVTASSKLIGSLKSYALAMDEKGQDYIYNPNKWNAGDGAALIGSSFAIKAIAYMYDGPYEGGSDSLLTWDSSKVEFENVIKYDQYSDYGFPTYSWDNLEIKYGVHKTNKSTGITSIEEINSALYENFDWYSTPEEAKKNGKIAAMYINDPDNKGYKIVRNYYIKFKSINSNENIGTTANFRHKIRAYGDKERKTIYYYEGESNYNSSTYFKPTTYNKNGVVTTYKSPYEAGETVMLVGVKTSVSTTVSDKDSNGNTKKSYDIGDGEINFKITPALSNDQTASNSDEYIDSVLIKTILPAGLSYKTDSSNKEPKRVTMNADGTTTIEWEYNNWQINHSAPDYSNITFKAEILASLENNASLEIKSTIFTEQDLRSETVFRTGTYGVIISNLAGSKALKSIDKNLFDRNEAFTITSTIGNTSQEVLKNVKSLEILPVNGDSNGSMISGKFTVKVIDLADNQNLYYTTGNINDIGITQDKYGKNTIKEVDLSNDSRWIKITENEIIPSTATAIASQIDTISPYTNITYQLQIIPTDNNQGNIYAFTMNVTSDNFTQAVKSNSVIATITARNIEGFAFIDVNRNDIYDDGDTLLNNNIVKLLDSDGNIVSTTQTDSKGKYIFSKVDKGNYYIEFSIPTNYELISKNSGDISISSVVNSNNKTDLITGQNSPPEKETITISNQNLGIRKIDATLTVHHYIDGTTTKLASDQVSTVYYGDTYTTDIHKDIPGIYELKSKSNNYTGIVKSKTIDVIYYYQKKNSSLETSITKTGPDQITKKDEIIEYTITYNAKVADYIGNGTITIVDTLPYHIDIEKSNLSEGTYNSEKNTITWTIPWNNIDSLNNKEETTITKTISVVYTDLLPTERIMINSVSGTISLDNNSKTIENQSSTKIKIPGTIIVHHYLKDTEIELEPSETLTDLVGETITTTSLKKEGYIIHKPQTEEYTFTEEPQEVIYEYEKKKIRITTIVDGIGGSITGDEEIDYGNDSTKDKIVITPDEGYILGAVFINGEEIEITEKERMELVLNNFENMTEDIVIQVTFIKNAVENPETGSFANALKLVFVLSLLVMFYLFNKKSIKLIK